MRAQLIVSASVFAAVVSGCEPYPVGWEGQYAVTAICETVEIGASANTLGELSRPRTGECNGGSTCKASLGLPPDKELFRVGPTAEWTSQGYGYSVREVRVCCVWISDGGIAAKAVDGWVFD
jgi:hypothetical protein